MRLIAFLLVGFLPSFAWAACSGSDLRDTLTKAEKAKIAAFRSETPFGLGNRWIARRDGQEIQIVGTMHLDDPRWPPIVERLRPVVENADLLLVEMTREEQSRMKAEMARDPSLMFIMNGPTLPEMLGADSWLRLSRAMNERGMPAFMVAKTQPWFLGLLLGIPACALSQGEQASLGLDKRLANIANDAGVSRSGLEEYEFLLELFATQSIEEQLRLLLASLPMAEQADDQFATVTAYYFDEDSAGAWAMADVIARRTSDATDTDITEVMQDMRDRLLDRRNAAWMEKIMARDERRIVLAVGALHLMGHKGLLNNLKNAGYTLERVPF